MRHNGKILLLGTVLLLSTTFVTASAFTTATVERQSTINVTADDSALIGLTPGDTDAVYQDDTTGEMMVNMDDSAIGVPGVNPNAEFQFGEPDTLNSSKSDDSTFVYAFAIDVNDELTGTPSMELSYTSNGDGNDNVIFDVYEAAAGGAGASLATATDETSDSFTPDRTTTYYVVLTVDTGAADSWSLDKNDNLGGTLTISVT